MIARSSPTPIRRTAAAPALFRSARASRDLPIVAFAAALFIAFAAHVGAFVPRIDGIPGSAPRASAAQQAARAAVAPRPLACEGTGVDGSAPRC